MYLKKIIQVLLFYFIVAPGLTFIHELAHGALPLILGEQVQIKIGGYDGPILELGLLTVIYAGPFKPWVGYTEWSGMSDIYRLALGPLSSVTLMLFFLYLLKKKRNESAVFLLKLSAFWLAGAFIFTAFPFHYPTFIIRNPIAASDGKQIFDLLFAR